MNYNPQKLIFLLILVVLFLGSCLFSSVKYELSNYLMLAVVFAWGVHLIYGYIFNGNIFITGVNFSTNEKTGMRFFVFGIGVLIVLWTILYLLGVAPSQPKLDVDFES